MLELGYIAIILLTVIVGILVFIRYFSDFQPVKSLEIKIPFRKARAWIHDDKLGGSFEVDRGNRGSGDTNKYHLRELNRWVEYSNEELEHQDDPFQLIVGKGAPTFIVKHDKVDEMGKMKKEISILKEQRDYYLHLYEGIRADVQQQVETITEQSRRLVESAKKTSRDETRT